MSLYTNLFSNPSFEVGGPVTVVRRNLLTNPAPASASSWSATGSSINYAAGEITVTTSGATANEGVIANTSTDATAQPNVSGGIWVQAPAGTPLYVQTRANGNATGAVTTNFVATGVYQFVKAENASSATGAAAHLLMVRTQTAQVVTFKVKQAILDLAPVVGPYFDGGFQLNPDVDFSTRWMGTANASASELTGISIPGLSQANCIAVRSSRWAKHGSYSMRLIPTTVLSTSYVYFGYSAPATVIATCHLEAPLTGPMAPYARAVRLDGGAVPQVQAPNLAGDFDLRVFQPASVTSGALIFGCGGIIGSGDVWWDAAGVFAGEYSGPWTAGSLEWPASLDDLAYLWYANRSGLTPASSYSLSDHMDAFFNLKVPGAVGSLVDLEKAFYASLSVPSGSIGQMRYSYFSTRSGLTPASLYSLSDHMMAFFTSTLNLG